MPSHGANGRGVGACNYKSPWRKDGKPYGKPHCESMEKLMEMRMSELEAWKAGVNALVIRPADLNYFRHVKSFESYTE